MHDTDIDTIAGEIVAWVVADRSEEGLAEIDVTADTALIEEEVFDSMKLLEFVSWLEETYGIAIGIEQLTPVVFATPRTVAAHVAAAKKGGTDQPS